VKSIYFHIKKLAFASFWYYHKIIYVETDYICLNILQNKFLSFVNLKVILFWFFRHMQCVSTIFISNCSFFLFQLFKLYFKYICNVFLHYFLTFSNFQLSTFLFSSEKLIQIKNISLFSVKYFSSYFLSLICLKASSQVCSTFNSII